MIIKGICEYILFIIKQRHIDNFIKSGNVCQRGAEAEENAMNPAILQQSLELKRLWGEREPFCWPFRGNERREEAKDRDNDTHQRSLPIGMGEVRLSFSPSKGALWQR